MKEFRCLHYGKNRNTVYDFNTQNELNAFLFGWASTGTSIKSLYTLNMLDELKKFINSDECGHTNEIKAVIKILERWSKE